MELVQRVGVELLGGRTDGWMVETQGMDKEATLEAEAACSTLG